MRNSLLAVLLLSSACQNTPDDSATPGGADVGGTSDVVYSFAEPEVSAPDAVGPGSDVLLSDVADAAPADAGTDASTPDAVEPVDIPSTDTGQSDVGPFDAGPTDAGPTDAGPTDAGPTDAGPTDAGGCQCLAGTFCSGGTCVPCTTNTNCGASCIDCSAFGQVCSAEGTACVQCDAAHPCGAGKQCVDNTCQACTTDKACGFECQPCVGSTPVCQGGACACTETSCPAGQTCQNGGCVPCNLANACGPSCLDCTATDTPECIAGSCQCTGDGQCGNGKHCVSGSCVTCGDSDPAHCGPSCAVCSGATPVCQGGQCACSEGTCPAGKWCSGGSCQPCNDAGHCGSACVACAAEAPFCVAGTCQQCQTDAHCDSGQWCSSGSCVTCGATDPQHCGPTCAVCAGDELCKGGACEPIPCQAEGCVTDIAPSAKKCSTARIIGRSNAQGGFLTTGDTTNAGNNDDLSAPFFGGDATCYDAKDDHFYRIYLFAGETMNVTVSPQDFDFDVMLKIYEGTQCDSDEESLIGCYNDAGDTKPEYVTLTATTTGWHTIVVDGRYAFDDDYDYGAYSIAVQLTCNQPDCCCQ